MQLRSGSVMLLFSVPFSAYAQGEQQSDSSGMSAHELEAVYTADVWRNARGGLRTGGVYLDNLDLTLSVDGERAWGTPGLSAFVYVLYNNSARFSERYVGDAMTASNIDAPHGVRLYEAWLEWASGAQPVSLRFGLYDLNSEFDTSDTRSLFIHSTHGVGHELGQTGENGPSIFPITSLAIRAAWEPSSEWRILAAVLDGVPGDRDHPDRTGIDLSSEDGALVITEAQWSRGRISKLSLGHWRYTAEFSDVRSTSMAALPDRDDNVGTYAALDVALGGEEGGRESVTSAFARYGVANGRINEFDEFFALGVRRQGLFPGRPDDEIGFAFSWAAVSDATRAAALSTAEPLDRYEAALELTYRASINEWLTLQPDIQFIFNPGANPALADSLALGLRFEFSMAAFR